MSTSYKSKELNEITAMLHNLQPPRLWPAEQRSDGAVARMLNLCLDNPDKYPCIGALFLGKTKDRIRSDLAKMGHAAANKSCQEKYGMSLGKRSSANTDGHGSTSGHIAAAIEAAWIVTKEDVVVRLAGKYGYDMPATAQRLIVLGAFGEEAITKGPYKAMPASELREVAKGTSGFELSRSRSNLRAREDGKALIDFYVDNITSHAGTADDHGMEGRPFLDHALTAACLVAGAMEGPTVKGRFPALSTKSAKNSPSYVRDYIKRVAKIMEIVSKHPIFTMDIIGPQTKANVKAIQELPVSGRELLNPNFWGKLRCPVGAATYKKLLSAVEVLGEKAVKAGLDVTAYHQVKPQLQKMVIELGEEDEEKKKKKRQKMG